MSGFKGNIESVMCVVLCCVVLCVDLSCLGSVKFRERGMRKDGECLSVCVVKGLFRI